MSLRHPVNVRHHGDGRTVGERAADRLASAVGSWPFVIWQNIAVVLWMAGNVFLLAHPIYIQTAWSFRGFDPFPFILLNLVFSWQAANTGPILQMTSNRQAQKDRAVLEHTYADTERLLFEIERNTVATLAIAERLQVDPAHHATKQED